jgi:Uma2 family endonuclease
MAITRYSVDDYEEMIRLGALTENDRVELIRGEIVAKMPIGDRHLVTVNRLNRLYNRRLGDLVIVSIQNPVRLDDSEPEPDVSLLRPREDEYASGKPRAADVLLLIEVSDSSLDYDRDVKKPLYAESGITEFWIVNLVDECLEVYRGPQPDGTYQEERVLKRGESTDIVALPGLVVAVDELF